MKYTVILVPDPAGGFSALAPAMPGCVSQGDTFEQALDNVREAMRGWLGVEAARGQRPLEETRDVVLDGVRQALEIVDEMRDAGEVPPDWPDDLRLTTVVLEQPVAA